MTTNQKQVGGGLQEGNLNVQKGIFRKQTYQHTALPFAPLGPPNGHVHIYQWLTFVVP